MRERIYDKMILTRRQLLKSMDFEKDEWESHQHKGFPPPPLEKPYPENGIFVGLTTPEDMTFGAIPLEKAIKQRKSRRRYVPEALKLEELSFLLWATQGVKAVDRSKVSTKRTVPSGGSRHPFETYLIVNRVESLEPGVYRYLPIEHKLLLVDEKRPSASQISKVCCEQTFVGDASVVFVWATVPYRTEWRYSVIAYKGILIDAGHLCQNLYLACEAIGAGTCAILAYDQKEMDKLIGVDGENEFTVYVAPVGRIRS